MLSFGILKQLNSILYEFSDRLQINWHLFSILFSSYPNSIEEKQVYPIAILAEGLSLINCMWGAVKLILNQTVAEGKCEVNFLFKMSPTLLFPSSCREKMYKLIMLENIIVLVYLQIVFYWGLTFHIPFCKRVKLKATQIHATEYK